MDLAVRDSRLVMRDRIVLSTISLALFLFRISALRQPYFDETYYVTAARALIAGDGPVNIEHPLVAKTLIAGSILLLGDNAFAWRLPAAICGAIAIAAIHWIAFQIFAERRTAVCAGLLVLFNQTFFIEARIATLEMPMLAGIIFGGACLLRGSNDKTAVSAWNLTGAISLGVAMGAKWLAMPYAALFLALAAAQRWRGGGFDRSLFVQKIAPQTAILALTSAVVYLATFWPAFRYRHDALTVSSLLPFQLKMLATQRTPGTPHPYQSEWWQWPLMKRPIWYLFETIDQKYQAILLIGNPLIYWGGFLIALFVISGWCRNRTNALMLFTGIYAFSLLLWVIIPKPIAFFYGSSRNFVGKFEGVDGRSA
jgi:dolichyl-phosphate-mannose-protein mannosyltransferase